MSKPVVVEEISNIALATGAAPVALIATFCENAEKVNNETINAVVLFMG
jgi:hypothetical protein